MSSKSSGKTPGSPSGRQKRTDISRLCAALFGTTPLAAPGLIWAVESSRFAAFLDSYQDKIGKKLRGVRDEAGFLDVLAELDVAHRLLTERSFTLVYEPYLADKQRGPDFAVTFKTHTSFMVEVRHLRPSSADLTQRLIGVLADKLRQLPAAMLNVLALADATGMIASTHVQAALQALAALAQSRDDATCVQRGFVGARDLSRRLERLSAVALLAPSSAMLVEHPRAQRPLPPDLRKALARALGGQ